MEACEKTVSTDSQENCIVKSRNFAVEEEALKSWQVESFDHALVARNIDNQECCVVVQDELNDDVPKAVRGLDKAGCLMKTQHPTEGVLCFLNVIGVGSKTASQNNLCFSRTLVGERQLETFHTPHFAPIAKFSCQRHVIGECQGKMQAAANTAQMSLHHHSKRNLNGILLTW